MVTATPEEMANWPTPNYVNPETRVNLALGWILSTTTLMLIFLAARLYSRATLKAALGADDWVIAAAAVFAVPISIIGCATTAFGLGYHIWDIKPGWAETYAKMAIAANALIPISLSLTKISLCLSYLRLFPSRSNKIFCWIAIIYLSCWTIGVVFSMVFSCLPVVTQWDATITQKTCIDFRAAFLAAAALNSFSDFLVFLWPARALWNIQLPVKQRVGLILVFAVGCIVCVAGICRMWYFEAYLNSHDPYWEAAILWPVTSTEINIGIVCGCLPGTKPLLSRLFPPLFSTS
ncbi:uncharacterized protein K441DRAFT_688848 [Cenococcum geophilum 1.58]|uniref:uncharacterized protein n=1 Tax=Cenococcum geophilum 1.58 TaxID=794803 RepID=UPI00358F883A|nr:hypothetical protein K441DRAFT_688848 [Cenococcum geophilum 1.58]